MDTTTLQLGNSVNRLHARFAFLLIALAWFALSPQARADCRKGCDTLSSTFLGDQALLNNTGSLNTAIGAEALKINTTGFSNTATGGGALFGNSTGSNNTATGADALEINTTGHYNTATGDNALARNTTGDDNTAAGAFALLDNTTGSNNTAVGLDALARNITGSANIALGSGAGLKLAQGSNNIYIGNPGVVRGESNKIRIGTVGTHMHTFIAGISGITVAGGVGVIIDSDGQLGTVVSSARFKEEIKPMDKASEAILALKPVTFCYKHDLDPEGIPQFGLVAEDVEKINPDLVVRDDQGKPYSVRYEAVNAMLLNEFLKEHKKVEEQQETIAQLKSTVAQQQDGFKDKLAQQQRQIAALTAGLQKVSAQLELNKSRRQTVQNSQ
jgi:Chaperone of endosialidase